MRRRVARSVLIALVLGMATNVLVTAWCVWRASTGASTVYYAHWDRNGERFEVMLRAAPGKAMFKWGAQCGWIARPGPDNRNVAPPAWFSTDDATAAALVQGEELGPAPYPIGGAARTEIAYGWPLLSFRGGITASAAANVGDRHDCGLSLPPITGTLLQSPLTFAIPITFEEDRTIPYVPILPGVLANTALYGGGWWVLLAATAGLRYQLRRRRNACPRCAYDRSGLPDAGTCPECGMEFERERVGRRAARRAAVLVVALGMITNVAATAVCVWRVRAEPHTALMGWWYRDQRAYLLRLAQTSGKAVIWWSLAPDFYSGPARVQVADVPGWARLDHQTADMFERENSVSLDRGVMAFGWPMLSFRGGVTLVPWAERPRRDDSGIALADVPAAAQSWAQSEMRTIPFVPIVPGFVVNTGGYAALWWMMLFLPGARRRARRRRGACEACGYDRRGIGADAACPECGGAMNVVQ